MKNDIPFCDAINLIRNQLGPRFTLNAMGRFFYISDSEKSFGAVRSIREALETAGIKVPATEETERYIAVGPKVLQRGRLVCGATSNSMARRIANALNVYTPDRRGL